MRFLRTADAPPVGTWDAASWARICASAPLLNVTMAARRYSPEELACAVFGRWPAPAPYAEEG